MSNYQNIIDYGPTCILNLMTSYDRTQALINKEMTLLIVKKGYQTNHIAFNDEILISSPSLDTILKYHPNIVIRAAYLSMNYDVAQEIDVTQYKYTRNTL